MDSLSTGQASRLRYVPQAARLLRSSDRASPSGVEWLGVVPDSWEVPRLGKYFDERREKVSNVEYEPLSVAMQGIVPRLETAAKTDAGDDHARDTTRELKGTALLSNNSFKMQDEHGFSKNPAIVHEVFSWVALHAPELKLISISVYGDKKPPLFSTDPGDIGWP